MKRLSSRIKNDAEKKKEKRFRETYPMLGVEGEDALWTPITEHVNRDLQPLVQDRMQDIAHFLYDSNPIAHRIIELTKDFIVGEGFTFKAKDEKVQKILDDFWNDPVNNWDLKQDTKALELALFGEQVYPAFVNKHNGHVRLGYIDPTRIKKVVPDKNNPEIIKKIILKQNRKGISKTLDVINYDDRKGSETQDMLTGEVFYFAINKVSSATRGRSDLLSLADWIDGYDQFLFKRLERANILNAHVWDILLEGADEKYIKDWLDKQTLPSAGSIRAHNEKVTWKVVSPKLEASDASNEARMFKMQILGGAGFPEHWFAEGSTTTRATALEMGLPTLKKLQKRQNYFKYMISLIFRFVIDQAIIKKALNKGVDKSFTVFSPPLAQKSERAMGVAAAQFTEALGKAQDLEWISKDIASKAFKIFMRNSIGIDIEGLETGKVKKEKKDD